MNLPKRKPTRLKNYDYSSDGAYFITICTHKKQKILSNIVGAIHESPEIKLSLNGEIVEKYIKQLEARFYLKVDKYVIMPNHIHLLIVIETRAIRESPLQKRSTISNAIGYLKMNVSRDVHKIGYTEKIWQRSFHDHIIRNEGDYLKIWNTSIPTRKSGVRIAFLRNEAAIDIKNAGRLWLSCIFGVKN